MTDESSRRYPNRPVVGVGVVVWHEDRFLLVRRGRPPREGQWSLPGGGQMIGETVREAARREVLEETGLEVEITGIIDVVDSITRGEQGGVEYHYTLVDVSAEAENDKAVAGGDAAEVAWYRLDDLGQLGLWLESVRIIELSAQKRKATRKV